MKPWCSLLHTIASQLQDYSHNFHIPLNYHYPKHTHCAICVECDVFIVSNSVRGGPIQNIIHTTVHRSNTHTKTFPARNANIQFTQYGLCIKFIIDYDIRSDSAPLPLGHKRHQPLSEPNLTDSYHRHRPIYIPFLDIQNKTATLQILK